MGGCRCCFRKCPVASERNRGMHFFKFPIKQKERFQQWIKLAGVEQLIDLGNKVICARHFPDTHFMNYKRNRLTMSALPSIHRLNEDYALDYSNDVNNPTLIELPPITRPHLIPPKDFPCTMIFTAADRNMAEDIIRSYEENAEQPMESILNVSKPSSSRLMQEIKKPKLDEVNLKVDDYLVYYDLEKNDTKKKRLVLKDETCELIEIVSDIETNDPTLNEELVEMNAPMRANSVQCFDQIVLDTSVEQLTSTKSTQCSLDENCDRFFQNVHDELAKERENLEKTKQELNDSDEKIAKLISKLNGISDENEQLKAQLIICEKLNVELNKELLDLKSENGQLKQHNKSLESQYMAMWKQKQQEQVTSSIPKQQKSPSKQNHQLTKVQLFNGIKKYLSQTMIAFLRIQLSSSSEERDWKPDERRLAVDLMGLGEDVYKFFTDEWVIRLPPIRQVRQWQSEFDAVDEEDDI